MELETVREPKRPKGRWEAFLQADDTKTKVLRRAIGANVEARETHACPKRRPTMDSFETTLTVAEPELERLRRF
jgi:hypothetical protein